MKNVVLVILGLMLIYIGIAMLGAMPQTLNPFGWFSETPRNEGGGWIAFLGTILLFIATLSDKK